MPLRPLATRFLPATLALLVACDAADDSIEATTTANDIVTACLGDESRPAGWAEGSHSNDAEPAYDDVFDPNTLETVTITVATDDYEAAYVELTELLGSEFGVQGGTGGPDGGPDGGGDMPTQEEMEALALACEGLTEAAECTGEIGGESFTGSCAEAPTGELACIPGGEGGADLSFLESDPTYFPVTVATRDAEWCAVGMRFKGNSSLQGAWGSGVGKLPFRLDFDKFEDVYVEIDDQRFYGFNELSFGNGSGDATLLRDVLASEILRDRGIPAAENAFRRVHLNVGDESLYLGVYTMAEDASDAMVNAVYGENGGNLYKPDGECADLSCFSEDSFEKKSNESEADFSDIEALVAALETGNPQGADDLDAVLNVDEFVRWLAVNTAMENWDTYGGLAHNYYLYAVEADNGRFHWIPWDHNLALADAFQGSTDPLHADVSEEWPLIRRVLDDAEWNAAYRLALQDALGGAYEESAFEARAAELALAIEPGLFGESGEQAGYTFLQGEEAYDEALESLYDHAQDRRAAVQAAAE